MYYVLNIIYYVPSALYYILYSIEYISIYCSQNSLTLNSVTRKTPILEFLYQVPQISLFFFIVNKLPISKILLLENSPPRIIC